MAYKDDDVRRSKVREHYANNKDYYKTKSALRKAEMREYINALKERTPCQDCGESYPAVVMDFDHRQPSQKSFAIALHNGGSWRKLLTEIEKCDIVCSNCHRIRTHITRAAEQ